MLMDYPGLTRNGDAGELSDFVSKAMVWPMGGSFCVESDGKKAKASHNEQKSREKFHCFTEYSQKWVIKPSARGKKKITFFH